MTFGKLSTAQILIQVGSFKKIKFEVIDTPKEILEGKKEILEGKKEMQEIYKQDGGLKGKNGAKYLQLQESVDELKYKLYQEGYREIYNNAILPSEPNFKEKLIKLDIFKNHGVLNIENLNKEKTLLLITMMDSIKSYLYDIKNQNLTYLGKEISISGYTGGVIQFKGKDKEVTYFASISSNGEITKK